MRRPRRISKFGWGIVPSLKVAAGEKLVCEPVYFGVYRRQPQEQEEEGLPLAI